MLRSATGRHVLSAPNPSVRGRGTSSAETEQGLKRRGRFPATVMPKRELVQVDPKALRKAVRATFGDAALVQRCSVHKMRNILEYLNDRQRPWAQAMLRRAYQSADVQTAQRLLLDLARRLETDHPSAAESVREGLDETLTVLSLKLSARLRRAGHDERGRKSAQSLASREAQCHAVAQWTDDAAVGRRGSPRSGERLSSRERVC
jgi:hypothetical protein